MFYQWFTNKPLNDKEPRWLLFHIKVEGCWIDWGNANYCLLVVQLILCRLVKLESSVEVAFEQYWNIVSHHDGKWLDESPHSNFDKCALYFISMQPEWMAPEVLRNELSDEKYKHLHFTHHSYQVLNYSFLEWIFSQLAKETNDSVGTLFSYVMLATLLCN